MKYRISNYLYKVLSFCVLTIVAAVLMFSIKNYIKAEQKIIRFDDQNIKSVYLAVSDVYDHEGQKTLSQFFKEENSLERMKTFYTFLKGEFECLDFNHQSLLLKDKFHYRNEFRIDYGSEDYGINEDYGVSLNAVHVDETTYDVYVLKDQVIQGRGFEPGDYVFENNAVPVLLGYEYSGLVDIGDTTKFEYLTKDISVKVIGFLNKDTAITVNNQTYFLDRYIVMPSLNVPGAPVDKEDERFQKILYAMKNWVNIKASDGDDYYDYKNKIDEMGKKLELKYALNDSYMSAHITKISNTLNSTKGVFLIAAVVLFFIFSVVFTYIYLWDYNRNKKVYAIHLICGCSLFQLKWKIYLGVLVQFVLSLGAAVWLNTILMGRDSIYFYDQVMLQEASSQTGVLAMVVMTGICFVLNRYINRSNIHASIQRED